MGPLSIAGTPGAFLVDVLPISMSHSFFYLWYLDLTRPGQWSMFLSGSLEPDFKKRRDFGESSQKIWKLYHLKLSNRLLWVQSCLYISSCSDSLEIRNGWALFHLLAIGGTFHKRRFISRERGDHTGYWLHPLCWGLRHGTWLLLLFHP